MVEPIVTMRVFIEPRCDMRFLWYCGAVVKQSFAKNIKNEQNIN
jgi:hypothetical protein